VATIFIFKQKLNSHFISFFSRKVEHLVPECFLYNLIFTIVFVLFCYVFCIVHPKLTDQMTNSDIDMLKQFFTYYISN